MQSAQQQASAATGSEHVPADHSRFVARVRRRYEVQRARYLDTLPGLPDHAQITALIEQLQGDGLDMQATLRVARQLVLERLAVLDTEQGQAMTDIAQAMTALAEVTLEAALSLSQAEADERYGPPIDDQGRRVDLWIVGMGKLGGRELNVSSDVDLVYLYDAEDGQTQGKANGAGRVSFQEYFALVARRLNHWIGDTTEDGFVFRMDLALRPNGDSGPPVVSLSMLEQYFQIQGREWERFAWLKSRVVAPRAAVTRGRANALRDIVVPFVFRRYLDYGIFDGLRGLHRQIRENAQRRAAGRPERANDVKLSRGGIREIEFIVQLLQVVRGGQFPEIRTRSTLVALQRLVSVGVMPQATAQKLELAYVFLRQLEHRIQYLDDQQTHQLPVQDEDLAWIAQTMGLTCRPQACELLDQLGHHREEVATEFDALLHDPQERKTANGCRGCGNGVPDLDSEDFLQLLPDELRERAAQWIQQDRIRALRDETRGRLAKLVHRAGRAVANGSCTELSATRFLDWMETLLRRESYLALLVERPEVQDRLLRMLGLARWPMRYLMRHPGVIDELADPRLLHGRFDASAFLSDMEHRHEGWARSGQADEEELLDTLRRVHHAEMFRTLVRDVESHITVEGVADDLSALADALLECTLGWAWLRTKQRHRDTPAFAVIAYGKLGGKELGYGGDLDIVFLYDDPDERAAEVYAAFARKLITWLTLRTPAGELFEIDTALRPNGNSGLLVTSVQAFQAYQLQRGSNTAWTWEHQAITRARFSAGDPAIGARFEEIRRKVLSAQRDASALREQIVAMSERVREAHPVPRAAADRFNVKHSPGGMMDVEFAVQYLVLAHAGDHPPLQRNAGNIALLRLAEQAGLLPEGVGTGAGDAYRELRRAQHTARLDEQAIHFDPQRYAPQREAVLALWRAVFG